MTGRAALPAVVSLAAFLMASAAGAAGNAKAGQAIFSRCAACHMVQKGGGNGLGPNLFDVVGRKAGSKPDFSYSTAMKSAGFVWTPQKLDAYIAHPAAAVPGNRMAFAGIPDAAQRADVIAYLATLK